MLFKTLSIVSNFNVNYISCSVEAKNIHKKIGYYHKIFKIIPNGYFLNSQKNLIRNLKIIKEHINLHGSPMAPQKDFETYFKLLI